MDFDITVRIDGETAVVAPAGDIDIQSAPALTAALAKALDAGAVTVVVDLERVSFLDSSALGALVGAHKRARATCGTLQLVSNQDKVLKLFRITRLTEFFPIYSTVDQALAADRRAADR